MVRAMMKYFFDILGYLIILSGVVFNQWVIKFMTHGQVKFEEVEKRIFLAAINVTLVLIGILIVRYKKAAIQNLLLFCCAVIFSFGLIEIGLRYFPLSADTESPKWIPYRFKVVNNQINRNHLERSKLNPYGFNDMVRPLKKPHGITRIAVLGDSFIWGVGVENQVIWSNKLERLLNNEGISAEILNWGKPGWSTLDQFHFLKSEGIRHDFDLLVVGFCLNDPAMDGTQPKSFIYDGGIVDRLFVQPLSIFFPNAISLFVDLINSFFNSYFAYGYANWLNKVYSTDNLYLYQELLKEFSDYCLSRNIRLVFVMTPENHSHILRKSFEQVIPMIENAGIDYVNIYPWVYKELGHIPNRKLWANPADGHPGDMVTDVFARIVHRYLLDRKLIQ